MDCYLEKILQAASKSTLGLQVQLCKNFIGMIWCRYSIHPHSSTKTNTRRPYGARNFVSFKDDVQFFINVI